MLGLLFGKITQVTVNGKLFTGATVIFDFYSVKLENLCHNREAGLKGPFRVFQCVCLTGYKEAAVIIRRGRSVFKVPDLSGRKRTSAYPPV